MSRLNHTTSWPELTAILLGRLSVLWLLVLACLTIPHDNAVFFAIMGVAFSVTVPYALWLRSRLRSIPLAPEQFLVDMLLIIVLITFTGGIDSELTLLYPLIILTAGITAPPRQAARLTVLSILSYLLMTLAVPTHSEPLQASAAGGWPGMNPTLLMHLLTFTLFGAISIYIPSRCRYSHELVRDAAVTLQTLLKNLDAGILMLDRDGFILYANPAACALTQATVEQLSTRKFADICASGLRPLPDHYGASAHLSRMDGPPVPVALAKADVSLPAEALPDFADQEDEAEITLVVLSDLTRNMELEHQLGQTERVTAATRIASEMAHEIRTPLTTISASIQLLQHYEKNASARDWLPNSSRKLDRMELFSHIIGASEKMDTVIQNFVDFAEFSPDDLLSIIKLDSISENTGYIGHLNTSAKGLAHGQNSDSG
jgi:two-component system sensor histidine kinase PilS (NtrC family)